MGVHAFPKLPSRSIRGGLRVVGGRSAVLTQHQLDATLEIPRYLIEPAEEHDNLSCARGIAMAFGLQAVIVAVIFGLWKLHLFLH